jgi:hypothetical protein
MDDPALVNFLNSDKLNIYYTFNNFDESNIYFFSMEGLTRELWDFSTKLLNIGISSANGGSKAVDKPHTILIPEIDKGQFGIHMTQNNIKVLNDYIIRAGLNNKLTKYYNKIQQAITTYNFLTQSASPSKPAPAPVPAPVPAPPPLPVPPPGPPPPKPGAPKTV